MKLDRREALKLAAGAALGGRALTGAGWAAPLPAGRFFDGPELALLDALSDTIIPADEH